MCSWDTLGYMQGEGNLYLPHPSAAQVPAQVTKSPIKPKHKNKSFSPRVKSKPPPYSIAPHNPLF